MQTVDLKPIYLLTGFLGSGKTTTLNQLLTREEFSETLVIINEFGEIGLDHLMVEASSDTVLELSNGCLCCSVRGELVDTLLGLDISKFDRIIIETTGIAEPLPIFQSLAAHLELVKRFRPASILTVVDCMRGSSILETYQEASHQLAIADMVYLSKNDLNQGDNLALVNKIKSLNGHAKIVSDINDITLNVLETHNPLALDDGRGLIHSHNHTGQYGSVVLKTDQVLNVQTVAGMLHHLAGALGEDLLRVKGFVQVSEHPDKPLVVQVSGSIVHDFQVLNGWPQEEISTRLVVITSNVPEQVVRSIFDGFTGNLSIDTPDRAALTQNPLAIPGQNF